MAARNTTPAPTPANAPEDAVIDTTVVEEMKTSFLAYAMSVIVSRALPDVRDGLKPVHRRLLYAMSEMNLRPDRGHVKSARVVGEVMGKFHPHGDSAIYDAMVRMAQDFAMRLPLVDGHGNFGTHHDSPAAMRYCLAGDTRVRMADGSSPRLRELVNLPADCEAGANFMVLDRNGRPVHASKVFNSGVHPVKRVELDSGHAITGSHNHPLLCLVPVAGVPTFQWLRLDEITPGTVVCLPRTTGRPMVPTAREYNLGVLAGAWVSEGWASNHRAGFNSTDEVFFDEVLHAYDQVVGGARYVAAREATEHRKAILELNVQDMEPFLASPIGELAGHRCADKFIPDCVWTGTRGVKRAFLMAAFEGDGGITYGPQDGAQVVYSTNSASLARELQELLLEFGVFATIFHHRQRDAYKLLISGRRNIRTFAAQVGFLTRKQRELAAFLDDRTALPHRLSGDHAPYVADYVRSLAKGRRGLGITWLTHNNFDRMDRWEAHRSLILNRMKDAETRAVVTPIMDSGYRFVRVASVEDGTPEQVYSLRVDSEDHAFLAGGFINHNTEARMAPSAVAMTEELDEDTVEFGLNYDGKLKEPRVLPAAFPNLLVNGSTGIAVGMATNMAPHNASEVIAACKHMLLHPDATVADLMEHIPGPDLPTGGYIVGLDGVRDAYTTGRGAFTMRARAEITDVSARRKGIIVTELPYMVGPEKVIARIKELRDVKKLQGVSNVIDLTDMKHGLRLVIECKTGFNPAAVLEELYKTTPLQESFTIHNLALVDGTPTTLTLRELVHHYVTHRLDVTTRRCQFRKRKAEARAHILEGWLIALARIEEVVAVIRSSRDTASARNKLMKTFVLSEVQADSILEMPLRRLTGLEVKKIETELKELKTLIAELTRLLSDDAAMRALICDELDAMARTFGTPRRTTLLAEAPASGVAAPSLEIPDEPCRVTLSTSGLIGRFPLEPHKGARTKHDVLIGAVATTARATVGVVTSTGRLLLVPVIELPATDGKTRGGAVAEFADLTAGETAVALIALGDDAPMLALATANGVVKRIAAGDLPRKSGQELIGLKDGDALVAVQALPKGAEDASDLVLVTAAAQLLRMNASSVRPQGRTGGGVAGIRLADGDQVLALGVVSCEEPAAGAVLVTCSDGAGVKTTPVAEYPVKGRGTAGVRCQRFLKGETTLAAAYVGPAGTCVGQAASGGVVKLPVETGRRDAPGTRLDAEIRALATGR